MPHDWMGWGWGWGMVGMLLMAVFWILVVVGIVLLVRWAADQGRRVPADGPREDSPLDILERRYARGEIDRDEFQRRKQDLS